jgi:hypothetical protein
MGSTVTGIIGGQARPAAAVTVDTADGQHRVLRQSLAAPPSASLPDGTRRRKPAATVTRSMPSSTSRNPGYQAVNGRACAVPDLLSRPARCPAQTADLTLKAFFTSRGLGVARRSATVTRRPLISRRQDQR